MRAREGERVSPVQEWWGAYRNERNERGVGRGVSHWISDTCREWWTLAVPVWHTHTALLCGE